MLPLHVCCVCPKAVLSSYTSTLEALKSDNGFIQVWPLQFEIHYPEAAVTATCRSVAELRTSFEKRKGWNYSLSRPISAHLCLNFLRVYVHVITLLLFLLYYFWEQNFHVRTQKIPDNHAMIAPSSRKSMRRRPMWLLSSVPEHNDVTLM
jgi:hypothetical protein